MDSLQWSSAARDAYAIDDLTSAAMAAERALQLADDLHEEAEARLELGLIAAKEEALDEALLELTAAAECKEELGVIDRVRLQAVLKVADVYRRQFNIEDAMTWLDHARDLMEYTAGFDEYYGKIAAATAIVLKSTNPERSRLEATMALSLGFDTPLMRQLAENRDWEPLAWRMKNHSDYAMVDGLPEEGEARIVKSYLIALRDSDVPSIHRLRMQLTDPLWRRDAWWEAVLHEHEHPARALQLLQELRADHELDDAWATAVRHAEADILVNIDAQAALALVVNDESDTGRDIAIRAAEAAGESLIAARRRRDRGEWGAGARDLVEDAYGDLDKLIGMDSVKQTVRDWCDLVEVAIMRGDRPTGGHVVMTGNPGTGKTTVARIWGKLLYALDLAKTDTVVIASRSDLVGEYVGHTAPKTRALAERARGGVLFIDEAYALAGDEFGEEAITTLLEIMENERDQLSVVIAGYESEIPKLWAANPGFRSRFTRHLNFPDYTGPELAAIAERIFVSRKIQLDSGAQSVLPQLLASLHKDHNWANAREMRNFVDVVLLAQARRVVREKSDANVVIEADIRAGGSEWWRNRG